MTAPTPFMSISPVTENYRLAFYDLIQEQAEQHASVNHAANRDAESRSLFKAVNRERQCDAFLVIDGATREAVTAVTYYPTESSRGAGLYLEDIVTTRRYRGRGLGSFALGTLAQITLERDFCFVAWECAAHNARAQEFYSFHGAATHDDRHTWRNAIVPPPRSLLNQPHAGTERPVRYRVLNNNNLPALLSFLKTQKAPDFQERAAYLTQRATRPTPFFVVAECDNSRSQSPLVIGFASAYPSFSTFRVARGLHINDLCTADQNPVVVTGLISTMTQAQSCIGWRGHTDITLMNGQDKWLEPVIGAQGFAPLAYGDDRMIVRSLNGESLTRTAQRFATRRVASSLTR